MTNEPISEKECAKCRTDIDKQLARQEERMNKKSEELDIFKEETNRRFNSIELILQKLTVITERLDKRDIFDKILIAAVFMMSVVFVVLILGPEAVGKIMGVVK